MQTLLWQRLGVASLEAFKLEQGDGFTLSGTVVLALDAQPASLTYHIATTSAWKTRRVTAKLELGAETRGLELRVDDAQRWWQGETELAHLRGLVDVDLSVTPATNTLAIRRLELKPSESSEVTAAWVKFPELKLEPLPQRYTCIGESLYRYESGHAFAEFAANLQTDVNGLVTDYSSAELNWRRLSR